MRHETLFAEANWRAGVYLKSLPTRTVFPSTTALEELRRFDEELPFQGRSGVETLELLDDFGSPATVASNGPNYYGFVVGGTLPEVLAAERLTGAWDQCAIANVTSPVADRIETVAAKWLLDVLELPVDSGVTFGTSSTSCGLSCLTAARRALLERQGWDFDAKGLTGAPRIRVIVPELAHVGLLKVLRILGFGRDSILEAPVNEHGRVDPARLPALDASTILCLQAGETNTGECDPFEDIVPLARAAGAWIHVDGAFGLWAKASSRFRSLVNGIEAADSWTVDGHKWLNTPYDGAVGICRDKIALAMAMNSDAAYAQTSPDSQKNLGLEFSRRARGLPIWVALRTLGHEGLAAMIERHCDLARRLADGLEDAGFEILNRVALNQVLFRLHNDEDTNALREQAVETGRIWFGSTKWKGRAACRMSISNWQMEDRHIDAAIGLLSSLKPSAVPSEGAGS